MNKRVQRVRRMKEPRIAGMRKVTARDSLYIVVSVLIIAGVFKQLLPAFEAAKVYATELMPEVTVEKVQVVVTETQAQEKEEEIVPSDDWEAFKQSAKKISAMYNFPAKVVIAQAALESRRGTSAFCVQRNNCLGIGAYDWNPDEAFTFENKEQGLIEYMSTIRRNFPEAWDNRDNADKLLKLLVKNSKGNYYASDPSYITKVMSMKEWGQE